MAAWHPWDETYAVPRADPHHTAKLVGQAGKGQRTARAVRETPLWQKPEACKNKGARTGPHKNITLHNGWTCSREKGCLFCGELCHRCSSVHASPGLHLRLALEGPDRAQRRFLRRSPAAKLWFGCIASELVALKQFDRARYLLIFQQE